MNYLAHVFLSGDELPWQLGGFLGDFIKGPLSDSLADDQGNPWQPQVLAGVRLHRQLDAYVDRMPEYLACVDLLGPQYRRLGGVAMDVFFDHLLANHWSEFCDTPLPAFSQNFYRYCERHKQRMPESPRRFILRAAQNDLFSGYGDRDIFIPVLERIDQRVRFETNLVQAGEVVLENYSELESRFLKIMPLLVEEAASLSGRLKVKAL